MEDLRRGAAAILAVAVSMAAPAALAKAPANSHQAKSATHRTATLDPKHDLRDFIPDTISPQARAIFEKLLPGVKARRKDWKDPVTLADFDALYKKMTLPLEATVAPTLKAMGAPMPVRTKMNGVGVVITTPSNYHDDGTILIRVHGGGWVEGSAYGGAVYDAEIAKLMGKKIISVDYTVAPRGRWQLVTDQVIDVYKAVLAEGYDPKSIGMTGDSAGGNIVPASVLKLRDEGLPMPGAILLLSPCVDLHLNGDTETTLAHADPALSIPEVMPGLKAYASPADWNNPYVSPIYGDFTKGFPPVLLQVGTKEMLLSDSVRFYQAVKMAGGQAELDVYEGMTHVFMSYMNGTPEQKEAFAEQLRFFKKYLVPTKK
jgi:epsilon-lactone hydrolase